MRQEKEAREFLLANLIAFAIGLPLFALIPAVAPWYYYHLVPPLDQAICWDMLRELRLPGPYLFHDQAAGVVCFPSFHVIWAILCAASPVGIPPPADPRCTAPIAAHFLSTLTTGWHYFADVIAGVSHCRSRHGDCQGLLRLASELSASCAATDIITCISMYKSGKRNPNNEGQESHPPNGPRRKCRCRRQRRHPPQGPPWAHPSIRWRGLWIVPCESVHTFFMRFSIDLVYLDRSMKVRKVRTSVPPWRISACFLAHSVIELAPGTIKATKQGPGRSA